MEKCPSHHGGMCPCMDIQTYDENKGEGKGKGKMVWEDFRTDDRFQVLAPLGPVQGIDN